MREGRGRGGSGSRGGSSRGGASNTEKGQPRRSMFRRRKICKFCSEKIDEINYKDSKLLASFVPEREDLPRRISGTCAMHQRKLQTAIKRARQLALLPYVTE